MHPDAVPLFSVFYNADAGAILVTKVSPPKKGKGEEIKTTKITALSYVPHMNSANKTFILSKKPFSISKCINKEHMRGIK